jgi:hypothetical protein
LRKARQHNAQHLVCDPACGECEVCERRTCVPLTGTVCGSDGSGLRCCNGTCPPDPTCDPVGTACPGGSADAENACQAACCSRRLVCGGATCQCISSRVGGTCGSDVDCRDGHHCHCGTCCLAPGYGDNENPDFDCGICCSGQCTDDSSRVCA